MESQRKKIQKTRNRSKKSSEKNQEEKRYMITVVPWADLPEGILELILGKLQNAIDLIRFRAVCKNWHNIHIPKHTILEYINNRRNLPWLCNLTWAKDNSNRLECQLYDPYSGQVFTTSKKVYGCRYTSRFYSKHITFLCSNGGWMIGHYDHYYSLNKWEIFMYNPYSQHFIPLSFTGWHPSCATFSGDPVSGNCRVFVFCRAKVSVCSPYINYIISYGVDEAKKEWKVEIRDGRKQEECCGIQYMNEQLFCLFEDGVMLKYSLVDGHLSEIVVREGSHRLVGQNNRRILWRLPNQPLWLAKGDGDLLVACELGLGLECSTYCFDFRSMSWVRSGLQEGRADVFISVNVPTFVRRFEDEEDRENVEDWKVHFFRGLDHPKYYGHKNMRLEHFSSTVFIDPPLINYIATH